MKIFSTYVMLLIILGFFGNTALSQDKNPNNEEIILDKNLKKAAKGISGFGGMFFDKNGSLNIYLLEDIQQLDAKAVTTKRAKIKTVVEEMFGKKFLDRRSPLHTEKKDTSSKQSSQIILLKGDYDIQQLSKWREDINHLLAITGVVFVDLDERKNRLTIGVESEILREQLNDMLKKTDVPREAIIIEKTKPVRFHNNLRGYHRPILGGVMISIDVGWSKIQTCTLGFNAIQGKYNGFVTNSHCTRVRGGTENTEFYQPEEPFWRELFDEFVLFGFVRDTKVGDEIVDPDFFTGGKCPKGRKCRYSDSAFIAYTIPIVQNIAIARTTGSNNGSLTIDNHIPSIPIVGEEMTLIPGSYLHKIGRTTGWTEGLVGHTCVNSSVSNTNITLLCQTYVHRIAGDTHIMSDHGDSGSPVFKWDGANAYLAGILWGGSDDGSYFVFSPIAQVKRELKLNKTYDYFSRSPPDPLISPPGGLQLK